MTDKQLHDIAVGCAIATVIGVAGFILYSIYDFAQRLI